MARIKVLHVMSGIGYQGGVQGLVWNYYKHFDTNKVSFDFLVHSDRMDGFETRFLEKGSKIFYVPPKREGLFRNYQGILKVMHENKYDAVHVHQDFLGYLALFAAKRAGIKVRIMHSHKANLTEGIFKRMERWLLTLISIHYSTTLFACGEEAGKWTYGENLYKSGKVYVLKNAIETKEFLFDQKKREEIRESLSIKDRIVVGNVARFTYQKNHDLLIDIAEKMKEINPKVMFILVGSGELFDTISQKVLEKDLKDNVVLLGERNDVKDLLHAMDVFILTSRFEGLPVTMVEAQASDLPCVVSDNITHEININKKTSYVKLGEPLDCWCDAILKSDIKTRTDMTNKIKENRYDIETEAKRLSNLYMRKINNQ